MKNIFFGAPRLTCVRFPTNSVFKEDWFCNLSPVGNADKKDILVNILIYFMEFIDILSSQFKDIF